ncbi:MAG: glucose-6-phosphate isomerase [Tenericutes bacterium HGW-Tenericutes-2]|jgi:glucose-6-phosphate isomerase|nr:MAG: glucose-6-phosphate isomerase [Tenericutes bacterium HGW-Tenericutes-2]
MAHIELNLSDVRSFLSAQPESLQKKVNEVHKMIHDKTGLGNEYLGWLDLPKNYDKEEYKRVLDAAKRIRKQSQVLVVIGIGGSYLGAKAGLEFLNVPFKKNKLEIVFAGHHMSGSYLAKLVEYLKNKKFSINVISKSGTTTEPAIAFRILKKELEERYGKDGARERIYATTDKKRGALYTVSKENGYEMFVIPDDVGGRFSVLTPVGLLPLAAQGINTKQILKGALDAYKRFSKPNLANNEAYLYAATRNLLYTSGKKIEMLVGYEPNLLFLNEWWKQLFGESEGKDHKGLFVASAGFSTDLHSLGQYIQEGERHLFETVIQVSNTGDDVMVPEEENDLDELNYLKGKPLSFVNAQALKGTMMAHNDGEVPNILLTIPTFDAYTFGYLVYFFEKACAMSAYLIDVNPFNQPGVEAYKKNMFALLGKKGYEDILK